MRQKWLDVAKGIAITLVVWGHMSEQLHAVEIISDMCWIWKIRQLVVQFHMPLFMMLSGVSFAYLHIFLGGKNKNYNKINDQRIKLQYVNIVLVYFIHSFLYWFFKFVMNQNVEKKVSIKDLILLPVKSMQHFWYLYVLACIYLIMRYVLRMKVNKKILIVSFVISIVGVIVKDSSYPILRCLYYFFYFYSGYYMTQASLNKEIGFNKNFIIKVITLASLFRLYAVISNYNIITAIINVIIGIVGANCIMCLAKVLENIKIIEYIGRHSLEVYLLHTYILFVCRKVLEQIVFEKIEILACIVWGVGIVGSLIGGNVLKRIPIIGKLLLRPIELINSNN